jgi:hypothetical protein
VQVKQANKKEKKKGDTARQTRWHRFWAVCLFRCEGASPEIPTISPEILNFPETPEKSPEYSGFTDKFVLSGDFQDSPIHPPGDIKILSIYIYMQVLLEQQNN